MRTRAPATTNWDNDYEQHCEVRESTMPGGALTVDAGQNGGITVEAWDRNDVRVRAIVRTNARTTERARADSPPACRFSQAADASRPPGPNPSAARTGR